jgi:1-aminocyclopropane-1-carboxylate deaminase
LSGFLSFACKLIRVLYFAAKVRKKLLCHNFQPMNSLIVAGRSPVKTDKLFHPLFEEHGISVSMLRLDAIHPVVSGNKLFKLRYFLDDALRSVHRQVITFGGAYSNHLTATAYACQESGLRSVGIVRGEAAPVLSHTLEYCRRQGMQLEFISRTAYRNCYTDEFQQSLNARYGPHTLIPEGGFSQKGVEGAALIPGYYQAKGFTHICCAIGTATTFAGLISAHEPGCRLTGFCVLKNIDDIEKRLTALGIPRSPHYSYNGDYHFGGYAKSSPELLAFMNTFYTRHTIPLDFVYTGKMMYGVFDLISKNYFAPGENILCIHTGGLQGNGSLPPGTLNF